MTVRCRRDGSAAPPQPEPAVRALRAHFGMAMRKNPDDWLVACLCAGWCGSCRDYRTTFEALARERPGMRFVWVDIEDEADALAPFELDIENFPTVLVARGGELRFLGTLLPHAATLTRTLEAAKDAVLVTAAPARAAALSATLREIGAPIR